MAEEPSFQLAEPHERLWKCLDELTIIETDFATSTHSNVSSAVTTPTGVPAQISSHNASTDIVKDLDLIFSDESLTLPSRSSLLLVTTEDLVDVLEQPQDSQPDLAQSVQISHNEDDSLDKIRKECQNIVEFARADSFPSPKRPPQLEAPPTTHSDLRRDSAPPIEPEHPQNFHQSHNLPETFEPQPFDQTQLDKLVLDLELANQKTSRMSPPKKKQQQPISASGVGGAPSSGGKILSLTKQNLEHFARTTAGNGGGGNIGKFGKFGGDPDAERDAKIARANLQRELALQAEVKKRKAKAESTKLAQQRAREERKAKLELLDKLLREKNKPKTNKQLSPTKSSAAAAENGAVISVHSKNAEIVSNVGLTKYILKGGTTSPRKQTSSGGQNSPTSDLEADHHHPKKNSKIPHPQTSPNSTTKMTISVSPPPPPPPPPISVTNLDHHQPTAQPPAERALNSSYQSPGGGVGGSRGHVVNKRSWAPTTTQKANEDGIRPRTHGEQQQSPTNVPAEGSPRASAQLSTKASGTPKSPRRWGQESAEHLQDYFKPIKSIGGGGGGVIAASSPSERSLSELSVGSSSPIVTLKLSSENHRKNLLLSQDNDEELIFLERLRKILAERSEGGVGGGSGIFRFRNPSLSMSPPPSPTVRQQTAGPNRPNSAPSRRSLEAAAEPPLNSQGPPLENLITTATTSSENENENEFLWDQPEPDTFPSLLSFVEHSSKIMNKQRRREKQIQKLLVLAHHRNFPETPPPTPASPNSEAAELINSAPLPPADQAPRNSASPGLSSSNGVMTDEQLIRQMEIGVELFKHVKGGKGHPHSRFFRFNSKAKTVQWSEREDFKNSREYVMRHAELGPTDLWKGTNLEDISNCTLTIHMKEKGYSLLLIAPSIEMAHQIVKCCKIIIS